MGVLAEHEPKEVLRFFEEICQIPHGSQNVGMISDYLVKFAKDRGLKYRQDEMKNVIIWKGGTKGYEQSAPVIIQGHMDMVAVKEDDCEKDLATEGLDLTILDGDLISAVGTSLGGDDGIAVAYALALLDSDSIPHPPLEVVVTVDEEIGMLGADFLDTSDLQGHMLLNIDSEDEGIFTVSCAGGASAICSLPYETEEKSGSLMRIKLTGLMGGHSGVEINRGRLNSNRVMGRLLYALKDHDLTLVSISGGEKDNVISKVSEAVLLAAPAEADAVKTVLQEKIEEIKAEYSTVEPGIQLDMQAEAAENIRCFTKASTKNLTRVLMNFPNGIQRMNPDMDDMVQTSLNIGILTTEADKVVLTAALRSSSDTEKKFLTERVEAFMEMAGGSVELMGNYPGWEYRPNSRLRDTMIAVYKAQYGQAPIVEGIHAGLECGLFASKIKDLDCISVGPQMHDIHSTSEVLSIASTRRTWILIKNTLAKLK